VEEAGWRSMARTSSTCCASCSVTDQWENRGDVLLAPLLVVAGVGGFDVGLFDEGFAGHGGKGLSNVGRQRLGRPGGRFFFEGFLPTRTKLRAARLEALVASGQAFMLFEAPQVISANGTQTLVQSGENYHYRHSAKLGKGTHVLLGTYKPTYWTKKADGKWAMAKTRADFPDAQSCGLYSMSGKSFVIIDDDGAFATKPLGKGYEITPLASPNDIKVGELAKFRVTLDGKPVAEAKVVGSPAGFNSEEVEIEAFYAETDKNGEFSFRALKPGLWYLSS